MEDKEIKKAVSADDGKQIDPISEKKNQEISDEALEERLLLSGFLVKRTDELTKEAERRKKEREEEQFELLSGKKISIKQIKDFVTAIRQPYTPQFPNSVPFFKEMYKLLGWSDKDPNEYIKPTIVGNYLNELIYDRFDRDVLPALQVLAMPDGIRIAKFFQFLNEEGLVKLQQYRDEAIALMKECNTWYEFRKKYGENYHLTVQKRMFED